jgi:nucleotide-binding universal stress UspA family protein
MTHVLVPVDGSEHDAQTLRFLQQILGGTPDLRVSLLHVASLQVLTAAGMEIGGMPTYTSAAEIDTIQKQARQTAERAIARAEAEARNLGLTATSAVRWGDPVSVILQTSGEENCDLIAMGSRGAGQIAGIFLGSVSDRVAHRAHVPVLIIHPRRERSSPAR